VQEYDKLVREYGSNSWDTLAVPPYGDAFMLSRGRGCDHCNHTGFKGRVALHELLRGSDELRNLIQNRAKTAEMISLAKKGGMITLIQDGILKVIAGLTTYDQVRTVAMK
jgi:type II secretory ATPase GspE/PulE/Tfp pilus assembly ATPase PilB-like protein